MGSREHGELAGVGIDDGFDVGRCDADGLFDAKCFAEVGRENESCDAEERRRVLVGVGERVEEPVVVLQEVGAGLGEEAEDGGLLDLKRCAFAGGLGPGSQGFEGSGERLGGEADHGELCEERVGVLRGEGVELLHERVGQRISELGEEEAEECLVCDGQFIFAGDEAPGAASALVDDEVGWIEDEGAAHIVAACRTGEEGIAEVEFTGAGLFEPRAVLAVEGLDARCDLGGATRSSYLCSLDEGGGMGDLCEGEHPLGETLGDAVELGEVDGKSAGNAQSDGGRTTVARDQLVAQTEDAAAELLACRLERGGGRCNRRRWMDELDGEGGVEVERLKVCWGAEVVVPERALHNGQQRLAGGAAQEPHEPAEGGEATAAPTDAEEVGIERVGALAGARRNLDGGGLALVVGLDGQLAEHGWQRAAVEVAGADEIADLVDAGELALGGSAVDEDDVGEEREDAELLVGRCDGGDGGEFAESARCNGGVEVGAPVGDQGGEGGLERRAFGLLDLAVGLCDEDGCGERELLEVRGAFGGLAGHLKRGGVALHETGDLLLDRRGLCGRFAARDAGAGRCCCEALERPEAEVGLAADGRLSGSCEQRLYELVALAEEAVHIAAERRGLEARLHGKELGCDGRERAGCGERGAVGGDLAGEQVGSGRRWRGGPFIKEPAQRPGCSNGRAGSQAVEQMVAELVAEVGNGGLIVEEAERRGGDLQEQWRRCEEQRRVFSVGARVEFDGLRDTEPSRSGCERIGELRRSRRSEALRGGHQGGAEVGIWCGCRRRARAVEGGSEAFEPDRFCVAPECVEVEGGQRCTRSVEMAQGTLLK